MQNLNKNDYIDIIDKYLERTVQIRKLSLPLISGIQSWTRYKALFIENAKSIAPLFEKNKNVIKNILNPILTGKEALSSNEIDFLKTFADKLQNESGVEYPDASLLWRISERLYKDALLKDDVDYLISQIDLRIVASSGKSIQAKSVNGAEDIWSYYQKKGQEAVDILFTYLEKEKLLSITSEETRELLVVDSRYFCVVYEETQQDPVINEMIINRLIASYEMSFDPDFTESLPNYNWVRHRVKCLEYLGQLTEMNNEQGITKDQAKRILEYVMKLKDFFEEDKALAEQYITETDIDLFITKNSYFAGLITNEEYKLKLMYCYQNRFSGNLGTRFKNYSTLINLQLPNEYIGALDPLNLTEEDITNIENIYQNVIIDALFLPDKSEFTAAMEYFAKLLEHYIEIPGVISFKEFCINFIATTMPRDYIHIISVAELTRCITGYLIRRRPELFLGMENTKTIQQVLEKEEIIIDYAYNAGLIHHIGKIGLLPLLSTAERPLFKEEVRIVNLHALSGRNLVKNPVSTSGYANIIAGKSGYYNDKETQKDGYNHWKVPQKVIVDILVLAGDIDKIVEKLEKKGTVFSTKKLIPKLKKQNGIKYAPYLFNILTLPDAQSDIDFILGSGRDDIYRRTFVMLKGVMDRGNI